MIRTGMKPHFKRVHGQGNFCINHKPRKGELNMTAQQIQKRSERAQQLRVLQVNETVFYVESAEGKICYKITLSDDEVSCTCGDYARNSKTDANFKCKHILAIFNTEPGQVFKTDFLDKKKVKLDERFVCKIEGKEFVKYPGLLDLGHQKGLSKILVDPLQLPTKENGNFAICKAEVVSQTGQIFTDIGDANPNNCGSKVAKHLLRMASTRSIARALRSFTNIGMTCLEELADFKDVIGDQTPKAKPAQRRRPAGKSENKGNGKQKAKTPDQKKQKEPPAKAQQQKKQEPVKTQTENPGMSEAQRRAVFNLSRRRGVSVEDLEAMVAEHYDSTLEDLSSKDASAFIRTLQQAA